MLQFLRKTISSWVGILILAVALGALVFTLFQPTGPTSGGQSGAVLATVGKDAITEVDYRRAIDRSVERERERAPQLTTPEFIAALVEEYAPDLPSDVGAKARTSLERPIEGRRFGEWIARFYESAASRSIAVT